MCSILPCRALFQSHPAHPESTIPNYSKRRCNWEDFPKDLRWADLICECDAGVWGCGSLTLNGSQDDAGVVVGNDVGVTILGLVHLQVGMFPGELLAWIDGLMGGRGGGGGQVKHADTKKEKLVEEPWEETEQ